MNKEKLPSNIKSIIINIDHELQPEFVNIKNNPNTFIKAVDAAIYFYYKTLYKRIFNTTIPDDKLNLLKNNLTIFIDKLTTGIYKCIENEYLYDEILEIIAKHIISVYYDLQIEYCSNNNINNIIVISEDGFFDKLITTPDDYIKYKPYINPLEISLLIIDKHSDYVLQGISFHNMPTNIKGLINKLVFSLLKYDNFITKKDIYFDNSENIYEDDQQKAIISYKYGFNEIRYNIIYTLLKDKLILAYDEEFWRDHFANILQQKYIADECYQLEQYLYHMRGEINHIEYFMSCIIAYILDVDKLTVFDYIAYKHIQRILEHEV